MRQRRPFAWFAASIAPGAIDAALANDNNSATQTTR